MAHKTYNPRRTTLTIDRIDALAEAILVGMPYKGACQITSTPRSSFELWMSHAREVRGKIEDGKRIRLTAADKMHLRLLEKVEDARARMIRRGLVAIQKAGNRSWQAWAWLLERIEPQQFSRHLFVNDDRLPMADLRTPAEIASEMNASIGPPP